jgi:hypothetical protein
LVDERLAAAGCTRRDLSRLALDADDLFAESLGNALGRAYLRSSQKNRRTA